MLKRTILVIFALFLTACASNPPSYLPTGKTPIVNIEADISDQVELNAKADHLNILNRTELNLALAYKLFWYDEKGVTQTFGEAEPWHSLFLMPKQTQSLPLIKPTAESVNYRIYLRGER